MNEKRCSRCGEPKPRTRDYFSPNKSCSDGLQARCKACCAQVRREERQNPIIRDRVNQRRRDRAVTDPDYRKRRNRQVRERRLKNPNVLKKQRERNQHPDIREKKRKLDRGRYADPLKRQAMLEYKRKRYADSPYIRKRGLDQAKRRYANDPDVRRAARHKNAHRRAREASAVGFHTIADVELQYRSQKGLCWHCGEELNGKYETDHLIPLARGGTDWPNNIVCSCTHCNRSRSSKLPQEWNGRLF